MLQASPFRYEDLHSDNFTNLATKSAVIANSSRYRLTEEPKSMLTSQWVRLRKYGHPQFFKISHFIVA
jgi:hypothetical protein